MPTLVLLWVWVCAYLNCAGWALSALHKLNAVGYAVALALGFAALLVWRKQTSAPFVSRGSPAKISSPFPQALSAGVFDSGGDGISRRRDVMRRRNYDALAYRDAAGVALAGGGTMALDPHDFSARQQPLLRYRMGFRAGSRAVENRPAAVPHQHRLVPVVAGAGIQRVHAARRAAARGVALDVAGADGLLFSAAGRQHRQRFVRRGVCAGGGGLRLARKSLPFVARFFCRHGGGGA